MCGGKDCTADLYVLFRSTIHLPVCNLRLITHRTHLSRQWAVQYVWSISHTDDWPFFASPQHEFECPLLDPAKEGKISLYCKHSCSVSFLDYQ